MSSSTRIAAKGLLSDHSDPVGPHSNDSQNRKAKRKRAAYSCTECTKAKAKCDRQQPCSRCVQRNLPSICHYLINGYEDPLEVSKDVQTRLARIESLLLQTVSQSRKSPVPLPQPAVHDHRCSQTAESSKSVTHRRQGGYITGGRYYGPSAMSYVGDGSAVDIMRALDVPDPETPENATTGDRRPPRALVDILQELPSRTLCDELVRLYFQNINLTRYPIRQEHFIETYNSLWQGIGTVSLETWVIHQLPLISIVLAISALSAPLQTLNIDPSLPLAQAAEKRIMKANELFHCSRRASAYSDGLIEGRGDIMLVMSDLLTVRYLILVRRAPDALPALGSAIFRAQALGLHRHWKLSGELSAGVTQERSLIWSYVYHMDRYCALLLGRPVGISDRSCDVEPPLNLDEMGIPRPLTDLTLTSFLVFRDRLARIMGHIAEEVYQLAEPAYEVIENLDKELKQWAVSLPPSLALRSYGQADEFVYPHEAIQVHRQFATVEYNFARICLHRPYLTRSDPLGLYATSREVCLQAALDDLWTRANFCTPGMENLSVGSYRVTNSLIILGITLLSNPRPDTLKTINECLAAFVAARKGNSNLLDDVKIKEIAMIEVLRNKADSSLTRANSRANSPIGSGSQTLHVSGLNGSGSAVPAGGLPQPTADISNTLDPSLQNIFDQFWGTQLTADLYMNQSFDNMGGERGGLTYENFNSLMESLGAGPNTMAFGDSHTGPDVV
ncbi:hypothetical protein V866_000680 [Kwoniella sp. B9012]